MQHINTFGQGIKRGMDYTILPQSSYTYLLNGTIVSRDDKGFVITAVKGTTTIASFSDLETPIGSIEFNGVLYIITEKIGDSGASICVYSLKGSDGSKWVDTMEIVPNGPDNRLEIPSELLGFSSGKLLQVFAKGSYDGSVDLYLCDGLNPNAVINTGLDRDGKKTDNQYKEFTHSEQFSFFKSIVKVPEVDASVESIGNLKPGTYYFYLRYEDTSLNATPFIKEIGPINIYAGEDIAIGVENEDEARVSKKIVLAIYDTDPIYNKVSIAVVYYFGSDGILSRENFMIDKSINIDKTVNYFTFTGDEPLRNITTEEIIADNIPYNTSETHLQLHNRYYGANWKRGNIDYDKLKEFARRVIPRAVLHKDNNFDKHHDINNNENEYMEKEIYPFGISFLIDGSFKTPVFPVCGWREGVESTSSFIYDIEDPFVLSNIIDRQANEITVEFKIVYDGGDYAKTPTRMGIRYWVWDSDVYEYVLTDYVDNQLEEITMKGLIRNTIYYYQVYLEFEDDALYSDTYTIGTKSGEVTIITNEADNITAFSATLSGTILSNDGADIAAEILISDSPISIENGVVIGGEYETYECDIVANEFSVTPGLQPSTLYSYVARVLISDTSGSRYSYGDIKIFETDYGIDITVTTNDADNITKNSARLNGYCYAIDDNVQIIDTGFYYGREDEGWFRHSISTGPMPGLPPVGGSIQADISGLLIGAKYYYRTYMEIEYTTNDETNSHRVYGEIKSFTTDLD